MMLETPPFVKLLAVVTLLFVVLLYGISVWPAHADAAKYSMAVFWTDNDGVKNSALLSPPVYPLGDCMAEARKQTERAKLDPNAPPDVEFFCVPETPGAEI